MTVDGEGNKDLILESHHLRDDKEKVGNRVVDKGQGSYEDDESRTNKNEDELKHEFGWALQSQGVLQVPQQHSQGSAFRWERFLHVRSIKVLLVENDDSTRHVVAALLRNCNYEVMEAANGLQGWKILEDLTNHVDLVLAEVVMPCLSGTGLLCKIMSHKTRKNIPVIMMSSNDSMGLVFKCLSKGASDFLVKPIRKNELRNLWQHVWRRCHSSSGSGSESGTQTQKSVKSSAKRSDDNSTSNDGDHNEHTSLKIGDGSGDGSGSQSSWTKQPVEVDSYQATSLCGQIADCPDSTCAQVLHSNAKTFGNKWVTMTATKQCQQHEEQLDDDVKGKELVMCKPRSLESQAENQMEVPIKVIGTKQNTVPKMQFNPNSNRIDEGPPEPSGEHRSNTNKAVVTNTSDPQADSRAFGTPRELLKILDINNKAIDNPKEPPVTELSLKRLRGVEGTGKTVQDDRNVLRRSELSAFSRYNTTSNAFKPPNGITGSSSLLDNTPEILKKESMRDIRSHSIEYLLYPRSNGHSNNTDISSTANPTKPVVVKDKSEATSAVNGLHSSSAVKPIKNDLRCVPQQGILVKADDAATTAKLASQSGPHQDLPIHHIHHHHHHNNVLDNELQQPLSNHNDFSLKKLAADAPHCGSTNVLGGSVEDNLGNHCLNISASSSNHGSNEQNGSIVLNAGGTNLESDIALAGKNRSGDASGSGTGNRVDQDKITQREAALIKFRQKRKERCFQKKVQYHNRKRLAEQRPRVRGQFVRQTRHDNSNNAADG